MDPISLPATRDCCPNGLSRAIEGNGSIVAWNLDYHNRVHADMDGVMGTMKSPSTPMFWLWHAYVDLIYKEWEINCSQSNMSSFDLYMKDHPEVVPSERDIGREPNIYNGPQYLSHDIWCRNQDDGLINDTHQDPISDGVTPTHVYVRVRNRGVSPSFGTNDILKLYWSKGSTALSWPNYWDGSITTPALMGSLIGSQSIPALDMGDQQIFHFLWYPPNPNTYATFNGEPDHFCLLARIESVSDPMTNEVSTGTWNLGPNVKNNNNIVWKNLSVIDNNLISGTTGAYITGGNVFIGNATDEAGIFDFEINTYGEFGKVPIFQDAEVLITMEEMIWTKWQNNGSLGNNIDIIDEENHVIRIVGDNASLRKLSFDAHERGRIYVEFNFLTEKYPYEKDYTYHIEQKFYESTEVLGGEGYQIIPPNRTLFLADAGPDVTISSQDSTELSAADIGEDATYIWYDENGEIIEKNIDVVVSPEFTTTYRLKVIADNGGLVDYDEVTVTVKPYEILNLSPNPATNQVTANYKINGATNASLNFVKPYTNSTQNFNLIANSNSAILNINNLASGIYTVILVCDGVAYDSKTLIIQ